MDAALELAQRSRWSERRWELREGAEVRGTLTRRSWWKRSWRAEAGAEAWDLVSAGWLGRNVDARGPEGEEAARFRRRRGDGDAIELAGGRRMALRRPRALRSERVLCEDARELARLRPRSWRRGIELELGPGGLREEGLALPVLLACAVLIGERDDANAGAAAAGGSAAVAGGSS